MRISVCFSTDKLLRWDLPFDRQPKFIQKVLKTIDYDDSRGTEGRYYYQALRSSYGTGKSGPAESKKASDYLESKGVQGTFFNKDKKIPGQNFVIFDPKRLTIIHIARAWPRESAACATCFGGTGRLSFCSRGVAACLRP